jgi:8-oxo-dGTP diphosphatase
MLIRTCLCLITRPAAVGDGAGQEVLLGFKKRGFGAGRWVGLGGHIEDGEASAEAAAREVREEAGLIVPVRSLAHMATLRFAFPARPAWDQVAEVFHTTEFAGVPAESDEVLPRWFGTTELPFDSMWDDARYWLPEVLAGHRFDASITFADDCATVAAVEHDARSGR